MSNNETAITLVVGTSVPEAVLITEPTTVGQVRPEEAANLAARVNGKVASDATALSGGDKVVFAGALKGA